MADLDIRPAEDAAARKARGDGPLRDAILEAAADLIVAEGYGACTMRAISRRVEVKAGSLYYYFASKDEIVAEVMNRGTFMLMAKVEASLGTLPADAPFAAVFHTALEAHLAAKLDPSTSFMQVYEHLPPVTKRQSRAMRQTYANVWVRLLERGKAGGEVRADLDLEVFVPYLLSSLNRAPEWFRPPRMTSERVAATIAASLLTGIRPGPDTDDRSPARPADAAASRRLRSIGSK